MSSKNLLTKAEILQDAEVLRLTKLKNEIVTTLNERIMLLWKENNIPIPDTLVLNGRIL